MNRAEWLVMLMVFAAATGLLCYLSYRMTSIESLTRAIERFERPIVGILFILIGLSILAESGTVAVITSILSARR